MISAPPNYDALLGTLVDGRYRVDRMIGQGGFGTVYAAFHIGLGAPVALKVLKLPERLRPDQISELCGAFFAEARTLQRLRHPNIVAAIDVGLLPPDATGAPLPYLVMQWCGGPTLRQVIAHRGGAGFPLREAWALFEPLLAAMEHAHSEGIAHRDLKPGNILIEEREGKLTPFVIDFGIAKLVARDETAGSGMTHTAAGASPFTPRYAAPEQIAQGRTGPWTDVHALALIFVELLTGQHALGDAPLAPFEEVRPTPRTFGLDVGALEDVLQKALAVRARERYPDAGAFASAMRAIAAANFPASAHLSGTSTTAPTSLEPRTQTSQDESLPPASHTIRTEDSGARAHHVNALSANAAAKPAAPKRRLRALALGAFLALAAGGSAAAVQHQHTGHGWPFPRLRVRDLTGEQIESRAASLGLGTCSRVAMQNTVLLNCERGMVGLYDFPYGLDAAGVRTFYAGVGDSVGQAYGASEVAQDGTHAVVVAGARGTTSALLDKVLDGAQFEERRDTSPPLPAPSTAATRGSLAHWSANDFNERLAALGIRVVNQSANPSLVTATVVDGDDSVSVLYSPANGEAFLSSWRSPKQHFVYARDGDAVLFVSGTPKLETLAFLKRVLGDAHTDATGAYPE
jgi:serine/threonine-protein kinase